jgi:hypothetical protein
VRNLVVDHIDGFEENTKQSNLRWLCKSCNTGMGIKMKREGKGRRTRQFNPIPTLITAGLKEVASSLFGGKEKKRKRNIWPFGKEQLLGSRSYSAREALEKKRGKRVSRVSEKAAKKKAREEDDSRLRGKLADRDIESKLAAHYAKGGTLKEFLQSNPGYKLEYYNIPSNKWMEVKVYPTLKQAERKVESLTKRHKFDKDKVRVVQVNPGTIKDAESLSRKWHGREPETETEIEEIERYSENVAELGDLEELGILAADLQSRFSIFFKKDRPKLCASDEHNLEFIGGDQSLKDTPQGVEREGKQLVPLGYIIQIVYVADKHHLQDSNGSKESYEHFFGEEFYKEEIDSDDYENAYDWFEDCMTEGLVQEAVEDGMIPMLVYNKTDEKMMVVGGKYKIQDVGIRN